MKTQLFKAAKPTSLLLSLSGTTMAILLSLADYKVNPVTAILLVLSALLIQLTCNVSSYDNKSPKSGKTAVFILAALAVCVSLLTIFNSFGTFRLLESVILIILVVLLVATPVFRTIFNVSYSGISDLATLLYFGFVAVAGGYLLCSGEIMSWKILLPAGAIGLFCLGYKNGADIIEMGTNDYEGHSTAAIMGPLGARIFQTFLIVFGFLLMSTYNLLTIKDMFHWLFLLSAPLFIVHLTRIWDNTEASDLSADNYLATGIFLFAILAGLGHIAFLIF